MVVIISASSNPGKIEATREAAEEMFDEPVKVLSFSVDSGVSAMPLSKDECRLGARNRARNALSKYTGGERCIAVGNEGAVVEVHGEWYLFGSTFATDGQLEVWGGETLVHLPVEIYERLEGGTVELGTVIDELTGEVNTKERGGAISELTGGKIMRKELFKYPVKQALVPWISPYHDRILPD